MDNFLLGMAAFFLTTRDALCVSHASKKVRAEVLGHIEVVKLTRTTDAIFAKLVACRQLKKNRAE